LHWHPDFFIYMSSYERVKQDVKEKFIGIDDNAIELITSFISQMATSLLEKKIKEKKESKKSKKTTNQVNA